MATDHNALKVEMLVMYKECMHNHAASTRGFLLDGCGLFEAPSDTTTGSRESSAVCGCHRNFHRRIEVEIPPRHRSSSIRHHHQQQQPASHPDQQQQPALHHHQPQQPASHPNQQQQPALHPHQPQQPASHHHHHRCGGGSGRGTMIIRCKPASAPGRFAPKQAAARRHALTISLATRPVQRGAPHRHAEGSSAAPQEVPPQHGVRAPRRKRITFGINRMALKNGISLHRRKRKAAIDQH